MDFLKFLLIFILSLAIIRMIFRVYGPYLLRYFVNRLIRKMEEDQRKRRDYVEANRMENQGKIRVDKNTIIQKTNQTSKSNHSPNQDIEDVDFQEVKH